MVRTTRIPISLPAFMKKNLEEYAKKYECSQAEVIRLALVKLFEGER